MVAVAVIELGESTVELFGRQGPARSNALVLDVGVSWLRGYRRKVIRCRRTLCAIGRILEPIAKLEEESLTKGLR